MIEMEVAGLKALDNALKQLPIELQRKQLRAAVAKASKILRDEVISKAPIKTGNLRDNIYTAFSKSKSDIGKATYVVGVRNGKKKRYANTRYNRRKNRVGQQYETEGKAFYWRFIEFGTKFMPARPFVRPAFEATKIDVVNDIKQNLIVAIKKLEKKYGKK